MSLSRVGHALAGVVETGKSCHQPRAVTQNAAPERLNSEVLNLRRQTLEERLRLRAELLPALRSEHVGVLYQCLGEDQLVSLLKAMREEWIFPVACVAAATGARRG